MSDTDPDRTHPVDPAGKTCNHVRFLDREADAERIAALREFRTAWHLAHPEGEEDARAAATREFLIAWHLAHP